MTEQVTDPIDDSADEEEQVADLADLPDEVRDGDVGKDEEDDE